MAWEVPWPEEILAREPGPGGIIPVPARKLVPAERGLLSAVPGIMYYRDLVY
jgi:hypothetical protein